MRSSSGPERRRRWRARSAAVQLAARRPPSPHGHGFEAATSMNRVGKTMTCWPRTIVTWPSSSGWRSASRLGRANSDSSSRNSTPRWASVASPGCGGLAPPTRPAAEIVWCGARNGRAVTRPAAPRRPGDRLDARDLDRLVGVERRQDRRQPAREHRLAGARRALQEQVVAARRGDLERRGSARCGRARRRGRRSGSRGVRPARPGTPGGSRVAAQRRDELLQRLDAERPRCPAPARPRARRERGTHEPRAARARRAPSATASAPRTGAHLAGQRQLADDRAAPRPPPARAGRTRRAARPRAAGRTPGRPCAGRPARG